MLEITNLCKSYRGRGTVLDNLSLNIKQGESVAITGPSGSGKTTLLNIIGLLDRPDSGTVLVDGELILAYNDEEAAKYRNRSVGFVFQNHLLMAHLTVYENIILPLAAMNHSVNEYEERLENIENLLRITGIHELRGRFPSEISGGESQRAALVRALANRPRILLADEPTGLLDEKNADLLTSLLVDLNSETGISVLTVTHSQRVASKMKTHYRFEEGRLVSVTQ